MLQLMRVVVLYRPNSDHGRIVEAFIRDFKYQHEFDANHLEVKDIDTREGGALASLYDILNYPAILILADDGSLVKDWQGGDLPLMEEIVGYLYNG